MLLSQRTAARARVDRDALWDAGVVIVIAAFVLSRLLLVLENLRTFLMYPVLVLELPSLTQTGELMTGIFALVYLRHRRLPLVNTLDAAAACGALVEGFLSLGRLAEGTREGMPTTVPWAVASSFGRVHPVELYSAIAWFALCGVLLWIPGRTSISGVTAAWGLVLGGMVIFFVDFFRLPEMLYGWGYVDSGQWHAVYVMAVGSLLLAWCVGVGAQYYARAKGVGDAV